MGDRSILVYNQTWEDPRADLHALKLGPDCRVVAIASAGCNLLNYLTANCSKIDGVDINAAHLYLAELRILAMKNLPDYESFFRFFGEANHAANVQAFEEYLFRHLDAEAKVFWQKRNVFGSRRIDYFKRGLYRNGVCGQFFRAQLLWARFWGRHNERLLECETLVEQQTVFEREIAPGFRLPLLRSLCETNLPFAPLGIPPAQVARLRRENRPLLDIAFDRVKHLCCDFEIADNYFVWQTIAQRYDTEKRRALPDYLKLEHYARIRNHVDRIALHRASMTAFLQNQPAASVDRYVLLDAQDWMNTTELNQLWSQIVRTAKDGAGVIFRTLATKSPLEEAGFDVTLRSRFHYDEELSRKCHLMDRSAVYGGFHLYVLNS